MEDIKTTDRVKEVLLDRIISINNCIRENTIKYLKTNVAEEKISFQTKHNILVNIRLFK